MSPLRRHLPEKAATGAVGLGLVAILGASMGSFGTATVFTAHSANATAYLSDNPRTCINCHIMNEQYDGWEKSAHHAVATCNECHLPHDLVGKYTAKVDHGWRHSKAFTLQNFHEPIRITPADLKIVEHNCVRCHIGLVGDITSHAAVSGEEVSCVRCHSRVAHGPR